MRYNFGRIDFTLVITLVVIVNTFGLGFLSSLLIYNFSLLNDGIIQSQQLIKSDEQLVKKTTETNLNNTFINRDRILSILSNVSEINNKLDKLLNQTSISK